MVTMNTKIYTGFKGVDFSTDPSMVDSNRSPYAPNMIADLSGMPEKRLGWRVLYSLDSPINGIFQGVIDKTTYFLIHAADKIYKWDGVTAPVEIKTGINNARSVGFNLVNKMFVLTGAEYLYFDGTVCGSVTDIAYIPTTTISRPPAGGGTSYENVNLVQPKRKNSFLGDGSTKIYQLDVTALDAAAVTATVNGVSKTETTDFTVDRPNGKVTFTTAPSSPTVSGQDNVIITFSKTVSGYADRVNKCSIACLYGYGTSDRVFLSGNPDFPNYDWHSAFNDPTYIEDLSYAVIGTAANAIMGYVRINKYLAIIKADNGQDSTVFLRRSEIDTTSGKVLFPVEQSISGIGAVAKKGIGTLLDEPLFLSGTGVYAITSNIITAERMVQNRSYFVDSVLTKESNLQNAICAEWQGYFIICINNKCYIMDGKQNKTYRDRSGGNFVYECYYWNNIPANCFCNHKAATGESLYFGTADGKFCRFNSDMDKTDRFNDNGTAIVCAWATPADDDGNPMLLKTMLKKGAAVTLKPFTRSSAKVFFRTDEQASPALVKSGTMDIADWTDIDFTRITFNSNDGPQEITFNKKVKKYKRLQILIMNDAVNEGFGIYKITKHYVVGSISKH